MYCRTLIGHYLPVVAIAYCQRAKILPIRALFNLFRNVMNFRYLRQCKLQVSHVSVMHLPSWNALLHYAMHMFARKQCIVCSALRHKSYPTLPHVTSL